MIISVPSENSSWCNEPFLLQYAAREAASKELSSSDMARSGRYKESNFLCASTYLVSAKILSITWPVMSGRHNQFFFLSMAKGHGRRGAGTRASGRGSLSASLTREKVPMDEVDQFAAARDKILLDERPLYEPDEEEENFGADNREVLGLDETDDGDEEADSEDEQLDEGEEVNDDQFDEDEDTERYRTMYIPEEIAQAATSRRALRDEAHEEQEEPEDRNEEIN